MLKSASLEVKGIDVSRWQGEINWQMVAAAGCKFAAIRATVGNYYMDPYFERNREGAILFEIYPLYYHVVAPENSIKSQMDNFMKAIGDIGHARPVMDIELTRDKTKEVITEVVKGCLSEASDRCKKVAMAYSNAYFWHTYIIDKGWSRGYEKWIANYRSTPPPSLPKAWNAWTLWQWTNKGTWPGISGAVDLNYFNGSGDEFLEWAGARSLSLEERVMRL
ncbi:MAG: glycoside hydrolase family 25 protein, partial [Anaerolineales bacterium]